MTEWHILREHCKCRQCNAARVKEEIERVHKEHEVKIDRTLTTKKEDNILR
jgi:hypothetical protein